MATFKRVQSPPTGPVDIETLFRDLPGRSDPYKYIWSHQADLLREYQSHLTASDVALELPTGSGKTLVGLLIAEYRRRRDKARVVYLCPTRQLCHQVARQAKALGIPASTLVGKQKDYDPQEFGDYRTGASLAITTYNGIFNTNPRISDPQIVIVDDAHAADQYISSLWTVRIARDEQADLYAALLDLLADGLPDRAVQRLRDDDADPDAKSLVDAAPYTTLFHSRTQIAELLDSRAGDSEKVSWTYSWRKISGHLHACQAWLSWDEIMLRPYICPTLTHAPFSQASQRIYMSATLGAGGELERALGIPDIARLPIPTGWEKRGTGRRFFVFPERSLDAPGVDTVLGGVLALTPRSLGLSPSRTGAKFLASAVQRLRPGVTVVTADQVEDDLAPFTRANPAHLSLSGRYDGIDLAGDTCRFVVVNDLPGATDLVEQFFLTRLSAHALLRDRIRTRFTQAVGRCSRGDNDHSLVMVRGGRLLDYCSDPNFINTLHPELQAEVRFGLENSEVDGPGTLVDLSAAFLKQSPDWLDAESSIRELRDQSSRAEDPSAAALRVTAKSEVRASYDLWNGHYENAVERCREVADQLPGEALKSYRSWWCYQAACAAVASNEAGAGTGYLAIARDYFVRAANGAPSVSWFMDMARKLPKDVSEQAQQLQRPEDILLAVQAENMLRYVESEGFTGRKFFHTIQSVLDGLRVDDATKFSMAVQGLGRLLGFDTLRPPDQGAPDGLWNLGGRVLLAFEAKSDEGAESDQRVPLRNVREAAGHLNWAKGRGMECHADAAVVLLSHRTVIPDDVRPHGKRVFLVDIPSFRKFADEAVSFVRKLRALTAVGNRDLLLEQFTANLRESTFTAPRIKARLTPTPVGPLGQQAL